MIIPGGNILNMAMTVIAKQPFTYYRFIKRVTNEIGLDVASYADPVPTVGSVQPVARNMYQNMGLDFQKNYANFWVSKGIIDITRGTSGDQFKFNGKKYQSLSDVPWCSIDGWDQVLCIEIPN